MEVNGDFFHRGADQWLHKLQASFNGGQNQFQRRTGDPVTNITNLFDSPPSPASLDTSTIASMTVIPPIAPSNAPSDSPSIGTTVLSIAVGCVAVFIVVPALAVLAFLYIRRWRRNHGGESTYKSIDDDEQDEYGHFSRSTRHYHDEIQLKDYENESKPSFEEAGPLAVPMSAVHVMPRVSRQLSSESKPKALGSTTIRSTMGSDG
ncbi:hypothetical protein BKA67DRAFT_654087 [Truncatella angustata]|uniref:Uncharacterized protein n=1 Tax=Truncatella angustata TaxID=152316 RepID=A0A9P8UZP2_9PEZI|nr:uncharacterized protein BKA67DRAFT_654087 [Truncatella angustata]KAH6660936.1 hypothetical protein BKA67DRAFT_654087 [Truncatella angustata]KAH8196743.1 hypothetical protein TruAng_009098 [Truncatella angustata]